MAAFVVLATVTEHGIKTVKKTVGRAEAFKGTAPKTGVTIKDHSWTLGSRVIVAV